MLDVVGADDLVVIANTGDDIEIYGAYVSPDPDLVTFWLADQIDERGWGLRGDTFDVMDGLRALGVDVWFNLGDRDLAIGLERARALRAGAAPDRGARRHLPPRWGCGARVLPMSDRPGAHAGHGRTASWWPFQEFMITAPAARGPSRTSTSAASAAAAPTPEVLEAIADARAIVIGPSNPVISIGPILALAGPRRGARRQRRRRWSRSARSCEGEVLKGPTGRVHAVGRAPARRRRGRRRCTAGLIDGLVADERAGHAVPRARDRHADEHRRATGAGWPQETLEFALTLRQSG